MRQRKIGTDTRVRRLIAENFTLFGAEKRCKLCIFNELDRKSGGLGRYIALFYLLGNAMITKELNLQ